MKKPIHSVAEDETVIAVARHMRDARIAFLPVCDRAGHLVGAVTEREIVRQVVADRVALTTT